MTPNRQAGGQQRRHRAVGSAPELDRVASALDTTSASRGHHLVIEAPSTACGGYPALASFAMTPVKPDGRGSPGAFDIAQDVVVRWKDHGQYGPRKDAVAALRRRADVPVEEAERLFDLVAAAHEAAVRAVPCHVRRRRLKVHPFASARDIDQAACRADVMAAVPDLPEAVCDSLLGWVVYWHWMR